ncbi:hypothetical protein GQ53DRAFT_754624, partial [Thozetella sp. PMI_491]
QSTSYIRFPRQDQPQDHFVRPLRGFAPFLRVHLALVRAQHSLDSHRHALSHVPLGFRCFNGPTYELDRKIVVLVPRCGY